MSVHLSDYVIAGKRNPGALAAHVEMETRMGHTLRNGFSLASVQGAIARGEDWGRATDWVM
jgi:hypothetical protein